MKDEKKKIDSERKRRRVGDAAGNPSCKGLIR